MFWDPLFQHVSNLVGAPPDQLKMVCAFLISYPLGSLFVRLPPSRPNIAHTFSLVISVIFLWPLLGLGTGLLHLLFSCGVTYLIVVTSRSSNMPWIVFFFTMGHVLINHAKRTLYGIPEGQGDITFAQIMMVQKLSMFAWNVYDGRRKPEELDESQLATRLQHVPSPLPFLGYWQVFFFPSVLIGPSLDYATYDNLVLHKIYDIAPPGSDEAKVKAKKRRVPYGRKRVAYLHLVLGLLFTGVYALHGHTADYNRILTPDWYSWSMATRFGFIQFAGLVARTKYYGAWSLTEGACILTGIGFNGYDPKTGRTLWNRARNVNIIAIETAESFKVLFDSWNCRTNVWLRDCVYKRLVKKGRKPGARESMATFVTSAIWHGIEPGYYLAFITAGLLTSLGRQFRYFVRPYFMPSTAAIPSAPNALPKYPYPNLRKRLYDVLGWFMVQINLNNVASAFILLRLKDCLGAWTRMFWYTHVLIVLSLAFFHFGGRRALRRGLEARGLDGKRKAKLTVDTEVDLPSLKVSPPSPPLDEQDPKDFRWVKHALDNPPYQDAGKGVGPDGGLVDEVMKGAETPRAVTSREGSPTKGFFKDE